MKAMSAVEDKIRQASDSVRNSSRTKSSYHKGGLFTKQRFCCANHADEEIVLDQIGWNGFNCPRCGCDYSIGRKIVTWNEEK